MSAQTTHDLYHWAHQFGRKEPPVLARTVRELARLSADEKLATPQRVSEIVLHDPLMTIKVLQYIQLNRHASQRTEITTIAHALMMLGLEPFFRHFCTQATLEQQLEAYPPALMGALTVASRSRHAALYARDWAIERHDIEVDEVMIAALLHDAAEMLLWCTSPGHALRIQVALEADHALRSEQAQRAVLGVSLLDVQMYMARDWRLPAVLRELIDDDHMVRPREANVVHAVAVARHSARGWNDAALPHDYQEVARLLGQSPEAVRRRVIRVALQAARDWTWYGVPPAAALLPLIVEGPGKSA